MLALTVQIDPDKIVNYFSVKSCLSTVDQHYTGKVSCPILAHADQDNVAHGYFPAKR